MTHPRGDTHNLGKIGTGILWLITGGLFGIGWVYDFCTLNSQVDERNRG